MEHEDFISQTFAGKRKPYTSAGPPLFLKRPCNRGKKRSVRKNLPFFAVEAYVRGGVQNQAEKFQECLPAGTGTKLYFPSLGPSDISCPICCEEESRS